ncbi:carboxypeptidase-like regulatory domain-containing protein [Hymenobacter humi]|uniref:Carboxypeptidase-like regulatory domain-containing protein n=1 Tax=Hymenobacter humi TaxID=1411620 RepID=A0ABW2U1L3_9BACT
MKRSLLFLSAICMGVVLDGCKGKDGDPGPAASAVTGNINGFVNAVDQNGTALNKSGITVSLEGANTAITTSTNADGKYEFPNVKAGTYNLSYTRTGLAPFRRFGVGHVGGDQPTYLGTLTQSQVSTLTVPSLQAFSSPSTSSVTFDLNVSSPAPTTTFRYAMFASATPNVSPTSATLVFTGSAFVTSPTTFYSFSTSVARTTLTNAGFASGSTVYMAAFGSSAFLASYSDPATGKFVYPSINPAASPVVSIVMP